VARDAAVDHVTDGGDVGDVEQFCGVPAVQKLRAEVTAETVRSVFDGLDLLAPGWCRVHGG
jgi:hypothetical protein